VESKPTTETFNLTQVTAKLCQVMLYQVHLAIGGIKPTTLSGLTTYVDIKPITSDHDLNSLLGRVFLFIYYIPLQ